MPLEFRPLTPLIYILVVFLEVILGEAIKKYNLPRGEIVVMTKVFFTVSALIRMATLPEGEIVMLTAKCDYLRACN
jgi:hypothetical protein